jgi:ABC-type transport system involved in multi-copper enzyme maturation permease subunit
MEGVVMNMRTLLWKDYRQNRKVLAVVGILVAMPYLFACVFMRSGSRENWASAFSGASTWALVLATAMTAFVAGNAIAGERADRSAEFAAYLPIGRRRALASKAILASGVCAAMVLFNLAVLCTAVRWLKHEYGPRDAVFVMAVCAGATGVLFFGVAWLFSALSNSPPLAAVTGIGSGIILAAALSAIEIARNPGGSLVHKSVFDWYPPLCLLIGLATFVAGTVYYLRRREP